MPKMDVDAINPKMQSILACLDSKIPRDMYDVAEELNVGYFGVYPYFRKLEELGYIQASPWRKDNKKTFVLADTSSTPKLHVTGGSAPPVEIFKLASVAPTARAKGTETGVYVNNFPYMLLRLYNLAYSLQSGHTYDKRVYQEILADMIMLRNRLENMLGAVNEMLAHPVMSGDPTILVDTLTGDPACPLNRDNVSKLVAEAEKSTSEKESE